MFNRLDWLMLNLKGGSVSHCHGVRPLHLADLFSFSYCRYEFNSKKKGDLANYKGKIQSNRTTLTSLLEITGGYGAGEEVFMDLETESAEGDRRGDRW